MGKTYEERELEEVCDDIAYEKQEKDKREWKRVIVTSDDDEN